MRTITATRFRANLSRTLQSVATGGSMRISSKWGTMLLVRETDVAQVSRKTTSDTIVKPKIPGRIIGTLDDADDVLREYLRMPK